MFEGMALVAEPKTKTVRLPSELANMLQTIASLKQEMGESFRSVEYLTELVGPKIRQLHAETIRQYSQDRTPKKKS